MVLAYRLMNRDPNVKRTRYGFFVERDRYEDVEPPWPDLRPPAEARTLPQWPAVRPPEPPDEPPST